MAPPCQTGQGCSEVEKAKLEMFKDVSKLVSSAISSAVTPHINKIEQFSIDIAVHAERMHAGSAKFVELQVHIDDVDDRTDNLESWRDNEAGAGEKSSKIMAVVAVVFSIVMPVLLAIFFRST